jgi:hypothetical protein
MVVHAGTVSSNDFKTGMTIEFDGAPYKVVGESCSFTVIGFSIKSDTSWGVVPCFLILHLPSPRQRHTAITH